MAEEVLASGTAYWDLLGGCPCSTADALSPSQGAEYEHSMALAHKHTAVPLPL